MDGDRRIVLGGIKQRATLGFLLFHANRVVPTSHLMEALWPIDPPTTARKILQNAVWSLRGTLNAVPGVSLVTQPPGYMLSVDTDDVDLYRFSRWVAEGRAELATGSPDAAATRLREALTLWQGSALADLVEAGVDWPEITSAQNARLDATEDYFEAELACGRHQSVLGLLEAMVQAEPLRERLCGQLMLALYRCGRQADALNVYGRVRAALVADLGLEPGRELQILQQAILAQDAVLDLPEPGEPPEPMVLPTPVVPAQARPERARPEPARQEPARQEPGRRLVSVLLVRAQPETAEADGPRGIEKIKDIVAAHGGTTVVTMGQVTLALFGTTGAHQGHDGSGYASSDQEAVAGHAVRAAVEIRDHFDPARHPAARVTVRAAVSTGEPAGHGPGGLLSADGPVLDACQTLLAAVPAGEIWVCDDTRRATAAAFGYCAAGESPRCWRVKNVDPEPVAPVVPLSSHELELSVLHGLLEQVRHRGTPHVVTLLGEPGIGKSRLIVEFERRVMGQPEKTQFLVGHAPLFGKDNMMTLLESVGGIVLGDLARAAGGAVVKAFGQLAHRGDPRSRLMSLLTPLAGQSGPRAAPGIGDTVAAILQCIGEIARKSPLVVIVEDVHHADDAVLDFVHDLADRMKPAALLVILTARPDLLTRRPGWGGGKRRFTTITMDPPPQTATAQREEFLRFTTHDLTPRDEAADSPSWLRGTLLRGLPYP
ncbi:BTAD domain-containing putative transcriptional regulator [Nonomuraea sp. NPDC050310]|uniref:BTAD domain-containing putative transcriptional regulator n=1 Tax=Nonomuraea sp. NPDC050310 TaxID=3154935 RepID=UPI0033C433D9